MINNWTGVGYLGADPELKYTPSATAVATARIAIGRPFKDASGEYGTDWLNLVAWRATAEFLCNNFKKGSLIGVTGRVSSREYKDRDGNKRTAVEIVVDQVRFIGPKGDGGGKNETRYDEPPGKKSDQAKSEAYDDPFEFE